MTARATNGPAHEEPGRKPKPMLSRACRGDGNIFAHEFCNNWHFVGGFEQRRYYCPCECHGDARYEGLLDPDADTDVDLTTEPNAPDVDLRGSEVQRERLTV